MVTKKRAWRRIDTAAEEAALAALPLPGEQAIGGAAGPPAATAAALPDAALFFEDKVREGARH
jgi:hypothetical protein